MVKKTERRQPRKRIARPLVVNRLEGISKEVFKRHYPLITELVGNSPGIYALYDGDELYYVGKSTDLRKRVRSHLRDRHLASWTHFSLYLARREEHIDEIESLLVRVASPKGNRVVPKGRSTGPLVKALRGLIRKKQKEELEEFFAQTKRKESSGATKAAARRRSIVGLVARRTTLYRERNGREYVATLTPNGLITYRGKRYSSPTAAAKAVVKRPVNGWWFWYIKDDAGDWVKLMDYRG